MNIQKLKARYRDECEHPDYMELLITARESIALAESLQNDVEKLKDIIANRENQTINILCKDSKSLEY